MTPESLAIAEQRAYAALQIHADDRTHREWCEARRSLEQHLRDTGRIVEHHDGWNYTIYSLGYFNTLHKRVIPHGRMPCSRRSVSSLSV